MRDWELLVFMDPLHAMEEVQHALNEGELTDAMAGVKEMIETMSQQERRTLANFLELLMRHIIKWKMQPQKRSKSWIFTIQNARREIAEIRSERPSITDQVVRSMWSRSFENARFRAANEMEIEEEDVIGTPPTWEEVFTMQYKREELPPFFQ